MSQGTGFPAGVNQAAVMETLAENPYIQEYFSAHKNGTLEDFAQYCAGGGSMTENPQVQILRDYLRANPSAGSCRILDVTSGSGVGTKVLLGAPGQDGRTTYYVGFQGTQEKEWYDNGEGMVQTSTLQQRDAAQYFDRMVREYGISAADHVIVTGHSKGGNKAQYVTLASENADLVDSCVALDGQGFSPEAVAMWEKYPDVYEARRDKILLVAGENDYVHVLGVRVAKAENTYYLNYGREDPVGDRTLAEDLGARGIASELKGTLQQGGDVLFSWHQNQFLFQSRWDEEKGSYVFSGELEALGGQGDISKGVQEISEYVMTLPEEQRLAAAMTMMAAFGKGSIDGRGLRLSDLMGMLVSLDQLLEHYQEQAGKDRTAGPNPCRELIHRMIQTVEAHQAREEQKRAKALADWAVRRAGDNPHIRMDTAVWDQLGATMRRLGAVDYAGIRGKLFSVKNELSDILYAAGRVMREAAEMRVAALKTLADAASAVAAFQSGDVIGGAFATAEAAASAVNTAKQAVETVAAVINLATTVYNSVKQAIYTASLALQMMNDEDILRQLGEYLSGSAQEFELAEAQNLALMRQWEV